MSEFSTHFDFIFNSIEQMACIFKEADKFAAVNNQAADFFRIDASDAKGKTISSLLNFRDAERLIKANKLGFKTGKKKISRVQFTLSGEEYLIEFNSIPHKNDKGEVDYLLCLAEDITDRIKKEENLFRKKKRCKAVFEQAPLAFIVSDKKNKIIDWNKSAEDIFGWSKEEAVGKNLHLIIPKDSYIENTEITEKIFSGEAVHSLSKNICRNGNEIYCEWNTSLIKDNENNILEKISIVRDVTEELKAEEKIKIQKEEIKYNELRTQFFANISHELKTPLNLIFSSLQLIDFHLNHGDIHQKKDKIYNYLDSIKNNGYRLLRLVNNVIDITRIDVNSYSLSRGNFDILKLCDAIVDSIENYIERKERKFVYHANIESTITACDPFNIERVILNLISNAVKFTNPGDIITLKLEKEADEIIISVRDTGIGIEDKNQKIIFEQFRQVDQSFHKKREGSGIGLYLVESIVKMHGGRVEVESEFKEYSEFKIFLPVKIIDKDTIKKESYSPANLLDKIEIEFSDIYNL